MRKYVLYHDSCADGFGAAFAAWMKFGDSAEYIPVQYGKPMPPIFDGSEVYILDFSYKTEPLIELWGRSSKLVVLDHHATARTELQSMVVKEPSLIRFDMGKSGAVLAWEYFHPELKVPDFILYLQDRDLWQWKLPMSREVSDAIRSYPFDFNTWKGLAGYNASTSDLHASQIEMLQSEGVGIRRMTQQIVGQMAAKKRWAIFQKSGSVDFQENLDALGLDYSLYGGAPVLNCTTFISETCEKMLELNPSAKFVGSYFDAADGSRIWSLRSRKDFDCSVIAKQFGGGGHAQAAGFTQKQ